MEFNISPKLLEMAALAEKQCGEVFARCDKIAEENTWKIQAAFGRHRLSESHFAGSTGYGYDDRGRQILENIFADVFDCEDALVRHNFVSGTHALTVALFGLLRPGDKIVCLTGTPYDTLLPVLGAKPGGLGSLKDFGIQYYPLPLLENGAVDLENISTAVSGAKVAYIQRSRGYSLRPSLSVEEIGNIIHLAREKNPNIWILVDNCYGEFVETSEPVSAGADLIAGSLIKNPGGGIARTGGYIAGKHELVEMCAHRLTAPGVGREVGCTLGETRPMIQGLFFAPTVVASAMKTAIFASYILEKIGFEVSPRWNDLRGDIIQCVTLGTPEKLVKFCKGVQEGAPVDSFVTPEPWDMPGYSEQVVMAAGAFTLGSSIELSADGPMRAPYAAWLQGGLTYPSGKLGILLAVQHLLNS